MYRTFDSAYVQNQLNMFHKLYSKELIFRDFKPVYWSTSSKYRHLLLNISSFFTYFLFAKSGNFYLNIHSTALAEAELEYDANAKSPSLYIRFKMANTSGSLSKYKKFGELYALIWTTTPWTLPSNQAICFNPELSYSVIRFNDDIELYIVATELISTLREKLSGYDIDEIATIDAADLESCSYLHPIDGKCELPFLKGKHVTSTAGTGLVHTAPAHGFDDYLIALQEKMPVVSMNEIGAIGSELL